MPAPTRRPRLLPLPSRQRPRVRGRRLHQRRPALSAAYGMADLEHDVPLRPDTIFEAGSVTKQFTAAAVLLLAQQGKLSLDDTVRKYIPELPGLGTPITIRHMLNHTSGLRDWGSLEAIAGWPRTTRAYTHAHVLEILSRQRALNYPPGAEYSYTNTGYNLAAILVKRVSGKPFAAVHARSDLQTARHDLHPMARRLPPHREGPRDRLHAERRQRPTAHALRGRPRQRRPADHGRRPSEVEPELRTAKVGGRSGQQLQQGKLTDGRTIAYAAGLMVLH